MTIDWQDPDPTAYDPDNPLALLEKAAAASVSERAMQAVWAVNSMLAAEASATARAVARDYVKRARLISAADFDSLVRESRAGEDAESGSRGPTQSQILATYAQERYTLHRDADDQPYALPLEGPQIARYLRGGRSLRAELAAAYLLEHGRPASSSALADALGAIEGLALAASMRETAIRAARHDGAVWLDLGREDGSAVKLSAGTWTVAPDCPVVWHRTSHTGALPDPAADGNLDDDLWTLARVPKPQRPLAAAWLCCALLCLVTPVLDINGEHGSGKTSTAMVIANTVDTEKPGGPPGNAVDLVVSAFKRMILILDNLEDLPPWLAATLCRLVTGEELSRRALFSDSDEVLISLRRPVITTSIDMGAVPADYADRRVRLDIPLLGEDDSMSEEEWAAAWADARPRAMGALLTLAAEVLNILPGIRLARTPRMGDYARVLAAVDQVLGTTGLDTYRAQRATSEAATAEADPVGAALLAWLPDGPTGWEGSMTDLLAALTPETAPRGWPNTPRALEAKLKKLAKPLRRVGITVTPTGAKEPKTRRSLWRAERAPAQSFNPSQPTDTPSEQQEQGEGSREGSEPRHADPSQILRADTLPDLQGEETKDVKLSAGTSMAARTEKSREDPRQPPQDPQPPQDAGNAGVSGDENEPSQVERRKNTPACPRHQTVWGAHPDCLDCKALAAEAAR